MLTRRTTLAALTAPLWAGCERAARPLTGGWLGANDERGHWLRDAAGPLARKSGALPAPAVQRRTEVLVVGGGVAGLGCLRALSRAGVSGAALLELEDRPGGNSRGHQIAGMRCPLGAHYLPVPGDEAHEVIELLEDLGLLRIEHGRRVYDERHLCHSPQERLYVGGAWHEGLVPPAQVGSPSYAAYRRFAHLVAEARRQLGFAIPSARAPWRAEHQALDAITFAEWLNRQGLHDAALRNYLDYCCRDDYGAGAMQVSAWAGLHYFASRHGFHAPGDAHEDRDAVLTWPEGNAWLARRLAAPLRERTRTGQVVLRVSEAREAVSVDLWNDTAQRSERWLAPQVVLAVPLFIAARLLDHPVDALTETAIAMPHAPWLVGNLHLAEALDERRGAPLSWDNVAYDWGEPNPTLGYVDAMHQSTRSIPGPTVLTAYWALGGNRLADLAQQRARLLSAPWSTWSAEVVGGLSRLHPDLPSKLRRVDLMRHGHAMSVPVPGLRGSQALQALAEPIGRLHFAHADLAAYSVFEEAFYHGTRAGASAAAKLKETQQKG